METKEIVLPKGWEVDKVENGKIILKEIKSCIEELPNTWGEYCNNNTGNDKWFITSGSDIHQVHNEYNKLDKICDRNLVNTYEQAAGIQALTMLLQLRDEYLGPWEPDWNNQDAVKYCIKSAGGKLYIEESYTIQHVFAFPTDTLAKRFLNNFRNLLINYYNGLCN